MAQRRMFSLKVVDTDNFLDMSPTAQNLYFHLGMRADDDGFVSNPKKIMKFVGAPDDDMKVLVAKGFIIPMATNGVCVITHWKTNNLIKSDRYTETIYLEEKSRLDERNGVYGYFSDTIVPKIGNGSKMVPQVEPQVRLGKVSIYKQAKPVSDIQKEMEGNGLHLIKENTGATYEWQDFASRVWKSLNIKGNPSASWFKFFREAFNKNRKGLLTSTFSAVADTNSDNPEFYFYKVFNNKLNNS